LVAVGVEFKLTSYEYWKTNRCQWHEEVDDKTDRCADLVIFRKELNKSIIWRCERKSLLKWMSLTVVQDWEHLKEQTADGLHQFNEMCIEDEYIFCELCALKSKDGKLLCFCGPTSELYPTESGLQNKYGS
jgi:hypothetical protein